MNDYNSIDPYGEYQTKGLDPYEMLMKMSSWNNELRSTITQVNSDLGVVQTEIVQQAGLIMNRVTYEDYSGDIITSMIVQDPYSITQLAQQLNLKGLVTITDLAGSGKTVINGANIMTKTIIASQLAVAELSAISTNIGTINAGIINGVQLNSVNINTANNITVGNSITVGSQSAYGKSIRLGHNAGIEVLSNGLSMFTGNAGVLIQSYEGSVILDGYDGVRVARSLHSSTQDYVALAGTRNLGIYYNNVDRIYFRINGSNIGFVQLSN